MWRNEGLLFAPLMPLTESLTTTAIKKYNFDYGNTRLWGSVSFIIIAFFGGIIVEKYGLKYVPILMTIGALFLFLSIIIFYPAELYSTHIRAGEIIAKRISSTSLTYEFTIIGYTDTGSEVEFGGGKFDFGDGNVIEVLDESVLSSQKILLENQVALNLFKVIHTFQAPGRYVAVSYTHLTLPTKA